MLRAIKKYYDIIAVVLFLLIAVILFFVFILGKDEKTLANLSEKEISEIETAFANYQETDAKLRIDKKKGTVTNSYGVEMAYYGSFGSCIVFFTGSFMPAEENKVIAGYTFTYPYMFDILVYNKGVFVNLPTAYKLGWLSKRQINKIHEVHNATVENNKGE